MLLSPLGDAGPGWFLNVGPLSRSYRVYAVDLIGEVNKSILTRPIRSCREFADWIADLFDAMQIQSAFLVGNSFGGFLTLNAALYLPERVNKTVLISPAATFVQMWAWYRKLFIPAHIIAPVIGSVRMVQRAYAWLWQDFPMDECYADLYAISKIAGYPRYRLSQNRVLPPVYGDQDLRRIRTPTLLLIGDHEVIYEPAQVIRRATRLVADLRAEIIENANHCAQVTAPQVVNKKMLDFFAD